MKTRKLVLLLSVLSSVIGNATAIKEIEDRAPYYLANVFDRDLYDLEHVNHYDGKNYNPSKKEVWVYDKNDAEKLRQKLRRLKNRKLYWLEIHDIQLIEKHKNEISKPDHAKMGKDSCKLAGGAFMLAVVSSNPITLGAAVAYSAVAGGGNFLMEYCFGTPNFEDLRKADILIRYLKDSIDNENILDIEKKYIENQDLLSSKPNKIKAIEEALLDARLKPLFSSFKYDKHIEEILAFPDTSLIVPYFAPSNNAKAFCAECTKFVDDIFPSLKNPKVAALVISPDFKLDSCYYSDQVRHKLKGVVTRICNLSYYSINNIPNDKLKRAFIFFGKSGSGKTIAAELIAEKCRLPRYEMQFNTSDDLSDDALDGCRSSFSGNKKGTLSKCFSDAELPKDRKERALNTIVNLNDIDKAIDNIPGNIIGLLQRITDLNTKKIKSEYYDMDFDWQHVIFIITINEDIVNNPKYVDLYKALKSRCEFVDFKDPNTDQVKASLIASLTDTDFDLSPFFNKKSPAERTKLKKEIADLIVDQYNVDDPRDRLSRANELLYVEKDWDQYAQNNW